jgi:hypothetical protein
VFRSVQNGPSCAFSHNITNASNASKRAVAATFFDALRVHQPAQPATGTRRTQAMNDEAQRGITPAEIEALRAEMMNGQIQRRLTSAEYKIFRAMVSEDGKLIDPANCEAIRLYVDVGNPYGVGPEDAGCIGGDWSVRALPDGKWIWFGDLPDATWEAVQKRGADVVVKDGIVIGDAVPW